MSAALAATAGAPSRVAWARALAAYERAHARLSTAYDAWEAASDAAGDETPPRPNVLFDHYRLNMNMKRPEIVRTLRYRLPGAENDAKVESLAAAFAEHQRLTEAADAKYRVEELWQHARTTNPEFERTRDALMAIPAPDIPALLVKIEIAGVSLDNDHGEAMIADARRLLSQGRA